MSLRIISGHLRGRRLEPPPGLGIRPTMDRAREALFNMLFSRFSIAGAQVLDVFAGSGAVGFEALSRGAASVVAVEYQPAVARYLQQTAEQFRVADQYRVVQQDALAYLRSTGDSFDFVFLDPPYALAEKATLLSLLQTRQLVRSEGLIVLEHSATEGFELEPGWQEARSYSSSTFSFFHA